MSETDYNCKNCDNKMVKGFAVCKSLDSIRLTNWVDGEIPKPTTRKKFGISIYDDARIDAQDVYRTAENKFNIRGLRCENCGLLDIRS